MTIQEIAQALEAKYPSRKLVAIAFNRQGVTERTGAVLMSLSDDSAANWAVWTVNFYNPANVYTVSGEYFHAKMGETVAHAFGAFYARIIP